MNAKLHMNEQQREIAAILSDTRHLFHDGSSALAYLTTRLADYFAQEVHQQDQCCMNHGMMSTGPIISNTFDQAAFVAKCYGKGE